ncbi:hypothetical protein LOD99_15609 [Oopsacas minuta]|uniref:Protein kinase domain-containing protein n=1 Tax=Oopsacas minuta TaxID=111878 RepID=A0AAV7K954_9METZ|nr:hypothetical protein LOD99_15609 [Oopsacas minuta]
MSVLHTYFLREFRINLRDIHQDYRILWHKRLGKGATQDPIYLATHIKTRKRFAVKMVLDSTQARREISLQRRCQHSPHVLSIVDVYSNAASRISSQSREEQYLYIVLEVMEGGTLLSLLEKFNIITGESGLSEVLTAGYFRQILLALSTLHQQGIIHRDLKPDNILLTHDYSIYDLEDEEVCADFQLQLADFGFAVEEADRPTKAMYTPYYAAPEVLLNDPHLNVHHLQHHSDTVSTTTTTTTTLASYDSRIDLWSLGVTLYILLSSTAPFTPESHTRSGITPSMYECIENGKFSFYHECWEEVSLEAKDLITGLLQADPDKRLSLQQVLEHPWLNSS